jgi:hypothetical protein
VQEHLKHACVVSLHTQINLGQGKVPPPPVWELAIYDGDALSIMIYTTNHPPAHYQSDVTCLSLYVRSLLINPSMHQIINCS